jgi:hypothetical protein
MFEDNVDALSIRQTSHFGRNIMGSAIDYCGSA